MNTQSGQIPEGRGTFILRALTLKLVPLAIHTFLIEKKNYLKNDAPHGIKGAFSAVFDVLSILSRAFIIS